MKKNLIRSVSFFAGLGVGWILLTGLSAGCTVTRIRTADANHTQTGVTTYTVAWPWLDTTKSLEKASLAANTNAQTISLAGLTESETVSTNATALFSTAVGAAVSAAIRAGK
jgi:hypothetical protein